MKKEAIRRLQKLVTTLPEIEEIIELVKGRDFELYKRMIRK